MEFGSNADILIYRRFGHRSVFVIEIFVFYMQLFRQLLTTY